MLFTPSAIAVHTAPRKKFDVHQQLWSRNRRCAAMLPHPQSWQRQTRYDVLAAAKGPPGHRMRRASRDDFAPAPAPDDEGGPRVSCASEPLSF